MTCLKWCVIQLNREEENVRKGKGGNDIIICVEDSLGWQNALIDEASVQFRLTTKKGVPIRVHPFCLNDPAKMVRYSTNKERERCIL